MAVVGEALNEAVAFTIPPAVREITLGLYEMESGGLVGMTVPVERAIEPAKPFRLVRVITLVPVEPDAKEREVGLMVKPKSSTTTLRLTVPTRVSGLFSESRVAYVPETVTK